jgi:phage terminase large subunit-like protein
MLAELGEDGAEALLYKWEFWGRPEQLPPPGDWNTWLVLAGRGFGKTRIATEWVRSIVCGDTPLAKGTCSRIAIVGETTSDCRDVLVEGVSGILAVHPKDFRPLYEPSKRRLTWPNGAVATLFNATEPDQLRGPQHDAAICDELAKWQFLEETWDMLQFGLRLGDHPRQVITTTPRPLPKIKEIMNDPGTVVTRGSTFDNRLNLPPKFIKTIAERYEGTRLGRQELYGEICDDVPGALWTRAMLDGCKLGKRDELPAMTRVIVAIDPANKASADKDDTAETGIVAVGIGTDGKGYLIHDASCRLNPEGWSRTALAVYDRFDADAIVAEVNQGGDMVESVIKSQRRDVKVIKVRASRGKVTRAEPISALYAQDKIRHIGSFPVLEDQMVLFTPFGIVGNSTADRVDALVWGFSELFPRLIKRAEWDEYEEEYEPSPITHRFSGRSRYTGY